MANVNRVMKKNAEAIILRWRGTVKLPIINSIFCTFETLKTCVMRNTYFILLLLLLPICLLAKNKVYNQKRVGAIKKTANNATKFIENNGQIIDQFGASNTACLFLLNSLDFKVQLRSHGFSYEIWKTKNDSENKNSINRIDLEFINSNKEIEIQKNNQADDYLRYFTIGNSESGIVTHQYGCIKYLNVWNGVDIEFITTSNNLFKYNFIVRPNADVSQIKLKISGSNTININKLGNIELSTENGKITESIPMTYQTPSKNKINSCFKKFESNVFGVMIDHYNKNETLIIDPEPIRLWGTYLGNNDADNLNFDINGNIYLCGATTLTTNVATIGGYQTNLSGNSDALLVKFSPSGSKLWGTYYGGVENDYGKDCAIDSFGNIYFLGVTQSLANIATIGAHDQTYNGNTGGYSYEGDAFLVKFSNTGSRIWGTYFGGSSGENAYKCALDKLNNYIYICGSTESVSGISSTGAHQINFGGLQNAYLAKFNSNGVRQWSTYYGTNGSTEGYSCSSDTSGNVYLCGTTTATGGIAGGGGAHQYNIGSIYDAYLVKFNNLGVRQWGTYYGGNQTDEGLNCIVDKENNIYLTGTTKSVGINTISTNISHQNIFGGNQDAFLVKFNGVGTRQWGTYYGGLGEEKGKNCCIDDSNNVIISGSTQSLNNISSFRAFQNSYQGLSDCFIAKFYPQGIRKWATYYGGPNDDYPFACRVNNNSIYFIGFTNSSTGIATLGSFQSNLAASSYDNFLVKFQECPNIISATSNSPICYGESLNLFGVISGGIGPYSYSWSGPSGFSSNQLNPILTPPYNSGYYTLTISDGNGCQNSTITYVIINPPPNAIINSNSPLCSGQTINLTANGGSSYFWTGPNGFTSSLQNPFINNAQLINEGTYSLTVFSFNNCIDTASLPVIIHPIITNVSSNSPICSGQNIVFNASGGSVYNWQGPNSFTSNSQNPTITNSATVNSGNYTIIIADSNNCIDTSVINVIVNPLPNILISKLPISGQVCNSESAILTASGASNYLWSNGITNGLPFVPIITTSYTVIATDSNNCTNTANCTIEVNPLPNIGVTQSGISLTSLANSATYQWFNCDSNSILSGETNMSFTPNSNGKYSVIVTENGCTDTSNCISVTTVGITDYNLLSDIDIYPNPTNNLVFINSDKYLSNFELKVFDLTSKVLFEKNNIKGKTNSIDLSQFSSGIYILMLKSEGNQIQFRIIKE